MKRELKLAAYSIALLTLSLTSCVDTKNSDEITLTEGLRFNESTLPYDGGVLIANFGGEEFNSRNTDGRGYVSILKEGEISTFIPADGSLSAPKGMLIKENYLLLCDVGCVVVYDLSDLSQPAQFIRFPEGEIAFNDLVVDQDTIYVSVTNSGNIYSFDGSDLSAAATIEPELWYNVEGANGMAISGSTLYVCSYPVNMPVGETNVIYKITNLEAPQAEMLFTNIGRWDGIAITSDGSTLYASSAEPIVVIAMELESGVITELEFDHEFITPADFSLIDNKLYIPDMLNSAIVIKELF